MKIISIIGVCTIIAYIILALHVAIEISQLRLANNHKCSSHAPKISLLERFESVEEVFLSPKIMEMPPRNEIACFVMTSAKSRNARSVIRRSWGKVIKPLFVLTMTGDSSTIDFLTNEAKVFDDMIVIRADESLRLAVAFTYFVENFSESKYFLYTHDDVLVNPENLYEFLNDEATPVSAMIGSVRRFPGRSWIYDSMLSYMQTRYDIEYLRESAFIIPGFMVDGLLKTSVSSSYSMPENVIITGYLPRLLNYEISNSENFVSSRPFWMPLCSIRKNAVTTKLSPDEIIRFWQNLKEEASIFCN